VHSLESLAMANSPADSTRIRAALKIKEPVVLIGLYNLLLALIVTAPVYSWFTAHLRRSRDTLQLLDGPVVRFLFELGGYDRTNVFSLVWTSFFWTAVGGFLVAVFLGAGLFAVTARPDVRRGFPYFFASAARFFPRFSRDRRHGRSSGACHGCSSLTWRSQRSASGLRSIPTPRCSLFGSSLISFAISGSHPLCLPHNGLQPDRQHRVPERPMSRALLNGFLFVNRRFVSVFGIAIAFTLSLAMLFAAYLAWRSAVSIAGQPHSS